jgi:hypothetical protein
VKKMLNREWFPTYTGEKINLRSMKLKQIKIRDIAHQLSLLTRFGGATEVMDSVAQHSVLVSMYLEREGYDTDSSLWGLLHDASEAYMGELRIGVKNLFPQFKVVENKLLEFIGRRYRLTWPMPPEVKKWDWIIGCNEAFKFVPNGTPEFFEVAPVQNIFITPWTSKYSEQIFLSRFAILQSRKTTETFEPAKPST